LIGSALQNQQERQRRGRNAKQFALQQYSWDAIAQQTIVAYQQILDGRQVS
jgi:glycosyltransferase involved in cell wall biosynthesis